MVGGPLDVVAVLARRDEIVHHLDDSSQVTWAEGAGIDVVRGRGRLDGARRVVVDLADGSTRTLHARHAVVLATGSRCSNRAVTARAMAFSVSPVESLTRWTWK